MPTIPIAAQLDKQTIEIDCAECGFYNYPTVKQIRLNDVLICRGCKINLQLVDHMGGLTRTVKAIDKAISSLLQKPFKITIRL